MQIYSPPDYALGDVSPTSQAQAERAIKAMRRSLKGWLKDRARMDAYVAGKIKPPSFFRAPGAKPLPPAVVGASLRQDRFASEQDLATMLYGLLSEMGIAALPAPNVAKDPDAAVKLAKIAIAGRTPSEGPEPQGIVWFALAIPIAGVVIIASQFITSRAEVAKEQERIRCIESGACTDYGFWLKVGAIATVGWIAWDKLGLREKVKKLK